MGSINGSLDLMGRHRILENTLYKNEAEGNPISFKTNVTKHLKEAVVELSPKQDLNGYDHPWVGGAGKNLFPSDTVNIGGTNPRNINYNVSIKAGTYYLSCTMVNANNVFVNVQFFNNNDVILTTGLNQATTERSFTLTNDCTRIYIYISQSDYDAGYTVSMTNVQIESGSAKTSFEPYENLCPIDSWGGKNLLPTGYNAGYTITSNGITFTVNSDGSVTVNGTATSQAQMRLQVPESLSGNYYYSGTPSGFSQYTIDMYAWNSTQGRRLYQWDGTTICGADDGHGLVPIQIPAGDNCGINIRVYAGTTVNNVTFYPMICKATTTNTTWQPYRRIENIVSQTGKNLLNPDTLTNKSVAADGVISPTVTGRFSEFIPIIKLPMTISARFIGTDTNNLLRIAFYDSNKEFISRTLTSKYGSDGYNVHVLTSSNVPINVKYFRLCYFTTTQTDVQIEYGSVRTAYEPYNPTSQQYTVTWENDIGEVFGGSLNLTTGEMVSEWNLRSFRNANVGYAGTYFYSLVNKAVGITNVISSAYKTVDVSTAAQMDDYTIKGHANNSNIYFKDSRYTSVEDFLAAMGEETICYKLATPVTYHLNPIQIKTLLETNVLTTDGDNIRVTYWKH